ncbi:MAG: MFS transporter, partial [Candidatus Nanopelagicales bacterium]|nr:MFS transporter [Candidatus Nanopelagicales bacterium]
MKSWVPKIGGLPREVTVLAAIAFCVALGFGIVIPAIPLFARTFGVSAFAASAVISVFALMRLVSSPPAGWAVNRFGERTIMSTGLAIVGLSSLAAGFATDYLQLLLLRGIGGAGSAMFTISATALLLRVTAPEFRGRASGAFQAGFLIGGVAGPAVGGLVIGLSIRAPFFVYAGTLLAAFLVAVTLLPRLEHVEQPDLGEDQEAIKFLPTLRLPAYQAALGANFTNGFVFFGLRSSLVPLFVVEGLRQGPGLAGVGFVVAAGLQAALLAFGGRTADRRGRRPALIIGLAVGVVSLALLAVAPDATWFLIAMAVAGVSGAFLGPSPTAIVGDVARGHHGGSVVAGFQMMSDVGSIIGPLVAGLLLDQAGFPVAFTAG